MKKIECIVQNNRFEALQEALRLEGVSGMTVTDVRGFGSQQTRPGSYLFLPKTKIEIYCADERVEALTETIIRVCRTGQLGDGKIAVLALEDLIRIRTGERKEAALIA